MAKAKKGKPLSQLLRVPDAGIDLSAADAAATPEAPGGKTTTKADWAKQAPLLADLQERLFANGRSGGSHTFLLVLQGLDSSGKGGTIKHVVGQVDPQGVKTTAFKAPTPEERRRGFLWRIRRALPEPGLIGVFDRSHYEDVVTVRVRELAPPSVWSRRYGAIDRFEQDLADDGVTIVKCFLHISRAEFVERQLARLDDPTKLWKYNPGDLDVYGLWDEYLSAYGDVLARCNPDHAPWYVIPADRKWYRNWAVSRLLIEALGEMGLEWPEPDVDVDAERARVQALGQPAGPA